MKVRRILTGVSHVRYVLATWLAVLVMFSAGSLLADSDIAHMDRHSEKPLPWPAGRIPYDISKLTPSQQTNALRAMQRWMDTGANLQFVPRTTELEYVNFTGNTSAGN